MRYTSDAVTLAMQKEARKRVRDMQMRGQRLTENANILRPIEIPRPGERQTPRPEEPAPAPRPDSPRQKAPRTENPPPQPPSDNRGRRQGGDIRSIFDSLFSSQGQGVFSSLGDSIQKAVGQASSPATKLLDSFGIGGEELLILMVMYMVFKEHGDTPLLLALGYLLL